MFQYLSCHIEFLVITKLIYQFPNVGFCCNQDVKYNKTSENRTPLGRGPAFKIGKMVVLNNSSKTVENGNRDRDICSKLGIQGVLNCGDLS